MKKIITSTFLVAVVAAIFLWFTKKPEHTVPQVEMPVAQDAARPATIDSVPTATELVGTISKARPSPTQDGGLGIAMSSFLPNAAVAGLTDEQLARLEIFLGQARKTTYELLVEVGHATRLPDGTIRIDIPAQSDAMREMKDRVQRGVEEIVGSDRMESLSEEMGSKFDAKFAYFGRYETTLSLLLDQAAAAPDAPWYVTMRSEYKRVEMRGAAAGTVRTTSVHRKQNFESKFFSVDHVNAGI